MKTYEIAMLLRTFAARLIPVVDLQTDKDADAVVSLLKKYVALEHPAKGVWKGGSAPFKHPCQNRPEPKAPGK